MYDWTLFLQDSLDQLLNFQPLLGGENVDKSRKQKIKDFLRKSAYWTYSAISWILRILLLLGLIMWAIIAVIGLAYSTSILFQKADQTKDPIYRVAG